MNKQDAIQKTQHLQQQMKEMQEQLKKLQEVIEAPEKKRGSLLQTPVVGRGVKYASIGSIMGGLVGTTCRVSSQWEIIPAHGNVFQTQELAKEYAKAINTMLLLRHQKGTVPAINGTAQYILEVNAWGQVEVGVWSNMGIKMTNVSPCFETEEDVLNAIQNVGEDNIKHMFATFHHTKF